MKMRGTIESPYTRVPGWLLTYSPQYGCSARARTSRSGQYPVTWQRVLSNRSKLAERWEAVVTAAQKLAWTSYATTHPVPKESGRIIYLNGWQWYCRQNLTALRILRPLQDDPPADALPSPPVIDSITHPTGDTVLVQYDNTQGWTKNPKAWVIVIERGGSTESNRTKKISARVVGFTPGIPVFGLPIPILYVRPYPLGTPEAFTYLFRIFYDR